MRILVISGTGFIGARVLAALQGHELTVYHRGHTRRSLPGVAHLYGHRSELLAFRRRFEDLHPDVVLDMLPQNGHHARLLVDSLGQLPCRVVGISSGSVYRSFGVMLGCEPGSVDNTPATEDAPLRSRLYPYRGASPRPASDPKRWLDHYDKIPAEQVLRGRGASIVRLPLVYGPGDTDRRLAGYLRQMLAQAPHIDLSEAAALWCNARTFVDNAAHAIARVVADGQPGRVYNVSEPPHLSEAAWVTAIGEAAGWSGTVRRIAGARPDIDEFPPQTNFAQHLLLDSTRIRQELGYTEPVPRAASLHRTVAHVRAAAQASPVRV